MSVTITRQGLFDTLQDEGRYGWQHLGINPGGVMDNIASRIANMLVGNVSGETVIEIHFPASSFYFEKACMIALSGGDFGAVVNDKPIPLNTSIIISSSSVLDFKQYKKGARCYLAVLGGWNADYSLGSHSTNTKVKAGGFNGRQLKKGDTIHTQSEQFLFAEIPAGSVIVTSLRADTSILYTYTDGIRYIKGREHSWLTHESIKAFKEGSFTISLQSDRMGYRLTGPQINSSASEIISTAVTKGTVQLLPNGQLIALMADHQTSGGYPRIAQVISADIPLLAQMQPNSVIKFCETTIAEAEEFFFAQQQYLQELELACTFQLKQFLSSNDFS